MKLCFSVSSGQSVYDAVLRFCRSTTQLSPGESLCKIQCPDSHLRYLTGQKLKVGHSVACSFGVIVHYQNVVFQSAPVNHAFGVTKLVRSRIQLIHKAEVRLLTLGFEEESLFVLLLYGIHREISALRKRSEVLKTVNIFFFVMTQTLYRNLPKFRRKLLRPYSSIYSEIGEGRF